MLSIMKIKAGNVENNFWGEMSSERSMEHDVDILKLQEGREFESTPLI